MPSARGFHTAQRQDLTSDDKSGGRRSVTLAGAFGTVGRSWHLSATTTLRKVRYASLVSSEKQRPRGDWPTIIGTVGTFVGLPIAVLAWAFPRSSGGQTTTSPDQVVHHSWLAQHAALLLYLGFLAVLAVSWTLYRIHRRPLDGFLPLIGGGIAFELFAWDAMSGIGRFVTLSILTGAFWILLSILWRQPIVLAARACMALPDEERYGLVLEEGQAAPNAVADPPNLSEAFRVTAVDVE
jgi:hypothetical protein